MKLSEFLEAGQIVNTHGIRGELRIDSWCDTPGYLAGFKTLYIDGRAYAVRSARPHKNCVITALEGIGDINDAITLKGKVVHIRRADAHLPEGQVFMADLIGLDVVDDETGDRLGTLTDVLAPSLQKVYVVRGEREILIPAVDEFIRKIDLEGGCVRVRLIEGM